MKKRYTKPSVEIVDFSLSSSIAGNCNAVSTPEGGFGDLLTGCILIADSDFCYHTPQDSTASFTS